MNFWTTNHIGSVIKSKTWYILLLLGISLVVGSCFNAEKVKIGMMLPNLESERYPKDRDFFTAKVKELGGEVIATDARENDALQIEQAVELLAQGVKVLVVVPVNKNTAALIVREAHKKGVKVIAYERIISNCDLDYFVSFDNIKIGEMMARYAINTKPEGNYVLFGGDRSDQNAVWVRQGQRNIIDPFVKLRKIEVTYDIFIENWSMDEATHQINTYLNLSGKLPDVILSAYDGISTGVIKAIDSNLSTTDYPVITGQNAELAACRNIICGKQSMTIYKPIFKEAQEAAVLAMQCVKNKTIKGFKTTIYNGSVDVPSILIEPIDINITNMKEILVGEGFFAASDLEPD